MIRRSASRRATPVVAGGVILVALLVATVLLEQVLMAQSAFKMDDIRTRIERAESKRQDLMLTVTRLENNERIESYARTRLGMIESDTATSEYMVADIDFGPGFRLAREESGDGTLTGAAAAFVIETAAGGREKDD